jgi:hypothetical protein
MHWQQQQQQQRNNHSRHQSQLHRPLLTANSGTILLHSKVKDGIGSLWKSFVGFEGSPS